MLGDWKGQIFPKRNYEVCRISQVEAIKQEVLPVWSSRLCILFLGSRAGGGQPIWLGSDRDPGSQSPVYLSHFPAHFCPGRSGIVELVKSMDSSPASNRPLASCGSFGKFLHSSEPQFLHLWKLHLQQSMVWFTCLTHSKYLIKTSPLAQLAQNENGCSHSDCSGSEPP